MAKSCLLWPAMTRVTCLVAAVASCLAIAAPAASAAIRPPVPRATVTGYGGGAATLDPYATKVAAEVRRGGGNAVDPTVAASAVLGVVEPFSSGIGGGGFMVIGA